MHLQVQWDNRLMTLGYLRQHFRQPTERTALQALPVLSSEGEGEEEEGDTRRADEQGGTEREEQKQQEEEGEGAKEDRPKEPMERKGAPVSEEEVAEAAKRN